MAFNSSTWQIGSIAGPAIGGLIFGFTDATTAFVFATVILGTSLSMLLQVPSYPMPERKEQDRFKTNFIEGWKFVDALALLDEVIKIYLNEA
jgi:MFS family permease